MTQSLESIKYVKYREQQEVTECPQITELIGQYLI